ncbi:MAG TPA: hypothetical protein VE843_11575 [Ktedonobacteraceae bacterium]|nr:hypothetical protein [Ktedonobacteraceae bacterium]
MMAWHNKPEEAVQSDWQARSAKKRDELSRSIEETLANNSLIENSLSDEEDEAFQSSKSSMIIPPKLSLQSKQLPAVSIESEDSASISPPANTDSVAVPPSTQKKRRLAGRSTKVHLQAVPKTEKKSASKISIEEGKNPIGFDSGTLNNGKNTARQRASSERGPVAKGKMERVVSASLAGSGFIKRGQRDVMITNTHVSSSSVVIVTLVEDPGPVVVKYISLHPQIGFTLHFSDAADLDARFNYILLLGELF